MAGQVLDFMAAKQRKLDALNCRWQIGQRVRLQSGAYGHILDIEPLPQGFRLAVGREDDAVIVRVKDFQVQPAGPQRGRP